MARSINMRLLGIEDQTVGLICDGIRLENLVEDSVYFVFRRFQLNLWWYVGVFHGWSLFVEGYFYGGRN